MCDCKILLRFLSVMFMFMAVSYGRDQPDKQLRLLGLIMQSYNITLLKIA